MHARCNVLTGPLFVIVRKTCTYICRIGSDEDDEGVDDETMSNEDPSETAVSRDARHEDSERSANVAVESTAVEARNETDNAEPVAEEEKRESQQPVVNHLNGLVRI